MIGVRLAYLATRKRDNSWVLSPISAMATASVEARKASIQQNLRAETIQT
jgi:hypothetical protein